MLSEDLYGMEKKENFKKLDEKIIGNFANFLNGHELAYFNATNKDINQLTMSLMQHRKQIVKEARSKLDLMIPGVSDFLVDYHTAQLIVDDFPGLVNFFIPGSHSIHDPWWKDYIAYFFAYIQDPEIINEVKKGSLTPEIISTMRISNAKHLEIMVRSYKHASRDRLAIIGLSREEHVKLAEKFEPLACFKLRDFILAATDLQCQDFMRAMDWSNNVIKNWLDHISKEDAIYKFSRLINLLEAFSQSSVKALFTNKSLSLDDLNCLALKCFETIDVYNQFAVDLLEFLANRFEQFPQRGHSVKEIFDSVLESKSPNTKLESLKLEYAVSAGGAGTRISAHVGAHSETRVASLVYTKTANSSSSNSFCTIM